VHSINMLGKCSKIGESPLISINSTSNSKIGLMCVIQLNVLHISLCIKFAVKIQKQKVQKKLLNISIIIVLFYYLNMPQYYLQYPSTFQLAFCTQLCTLLMQDVLFMYLLIFYSTSAEGL